MADSSFRSFRRDAPARDADAPRDSAADPLAELARLIGQSDPHAGERRDAKQPDAFDDAATASQLDWAAGQGGYAEREPDSEAPPRPAQAYRPPVSDTASWPQDREYEDEPPRTNQYFRPPAGLDDHDAQRRSAPVPDSHRRNEPQLPGQREALPSYLASERSGGYQPPAYSDDYARDEYEDEAGPPARRGGTIVILAVLGLAVLGTAGALGYRAMFGGSVLPSLPPIIKPGEGPTKIVPNHEAENSAPGQSDATGQGTGERVVPHQEQPLQVQPANPTPRVVTTIPVISNGGAGAVPEAPPPETGQAGTAAPGVPPPGPYLANPTQGPEMTAPATPPPPGTKEVHTLTIRPGQLVGEHRAPAAASVAHPAKPREAVAKPPHRRTTSESASTQPLSIVPSQERESEPNQRQREAYVSPRARTGTQPMALARSPARTEPVRNGGYAVQVSSQRSEAEAQTAFRSLQAQFPQQLGSRHVIVRRADLGSKGIYYRATVGPFSSSEEAASLCGSLKAAGGSCLIQRD